MKLEAQVPLAPLTTLEVGGPARHLLRAADEASLREGLSWARERDQSVTLLGGGSNVVVADRGVDGLVIQLEGDRITDRGGGVVEVDAGVEWDQLVRFAVERGLAGLECLSGIPGRVGAAPMQNIGAYGQEVGGSIDAVRVIDRASGEGAEIAGRDCDFGYRDSIFKREAAERYVVVGVRFRLVVGGAATVAYAELARQLPAEPGLAVVRDTVIALRRGKSMVLDPADPNRRSAGSFFVNPVVSDVEQVRARAEAVAPGETLPTYPAPNGVKVPAAWLIERAGFTKGTARGRVGISSNHCLALVNRGGASAAELLAFAGEIRARVWDRFGVRLEPEPRLLGFEPGEAGALLGG